MTQVLDAVMAAHGLALVSLGGGALSLVRKTGYLEYLAFDKFYGWFRDVTDVAGLPTGLCLEGVAG